MLEQALDAVLQRHRRGRAALAGAVQREIDRAVPEAAIDDVAAVLRDRRADAGLDQLADLGDDLGVGRIVAMIGLGRDMDAGGAARRGTAAPRWRNDRAALRAPAASARASRRRARRSPRRSRGRRRRRPPRRSRRSPRRAARPRPPRASRNRASQPPSPCGRAGISESPDWAWFRSGSAWGGCGLWQRRRSRGEDIGELDDAGRDAGAAFRRRAISRRAQPRLPFETGQLRLASGLRDRGSCAAHRPRARL